MKKLVKKLRIFEKYDPDHKEAADRIEELEAAINDIMDAWVAQQHHKAFEIAIKTLGVNYETAKDK